VLLGVAACDSGTPSTPESELSARAADGLQQSYTATYTVAKDGAAESTLTVWRTPTSLRLDVGTASGISTSITGPGAPVVCQSPTSGKKPTCLTVAKAGEAPPATFDPALRTVFSDSLRAFADPNSELSVTYPTIVPTLVVPHSAGVPRCFTVSGSSQPPVAAGTYCLTENGIPAQVEFASGTATLTALKGAPPASVFVPPVAPTPLPTPTA